MVGKFESAAGQQSGIEARPERRDQGPTPDCKAPEAVDAQFQLLFSAIYHDLCETRLTRLHRTLTALMLLLGSSAAFTISTSYPPAIAQGMALAVAAIGTVQLVWDFGTSAHKHAVLRQRFYELLADFRRGDCDEGRVLACMTGLFGSEPPMNERLRRKAHDLAVMSLYGDTSAEG